MRLFLDDENEMITRMMAFALDLDLSFLASCVHAIKVCGRLAASDILGQRSRQRFSLPTTKELSSKQSPSHTGWGRDAHPALVRFK